MPPKKMICEVHGCDRRSKGIPVGTLTIHRFPLELNEAEQWTRFSGSANAQDLFKQFGPVGVRKLFMCSQHFEPSCYKFPGTSGVQNPTGLRYGAVPTLKGPTDEPEVEVESDGGGAAVGETAPTEPGVEGESAENARKRKKGHLDDSFFDFLKDNSEDDAEKIPGTSARPKVRRTHAPHCVCNICRTNRAAKAMEKGIVMAKAIQTGDFGPQPDASPVPMGANQDSCRLCFTTDLLEPLCSGMIVVRDEMLDKIYVCTGILVIPRPKVSIFICTPCAQLINSFHAYRQQVCSNNRALLRRIGIKPTTTATPSAPKIQKVAPLPPAVRPVPMKRKPPAGLIPVATTPVRMPQAPMIQYRKIIPKIPMVVQREGPVTLPIKEERDDPLGGCDEMAQKIGTEMGKSNMLDKRMPKPIMEVKEEPPVASTPLEMEAEEGREDLPEGERWKCWHCENSFPFQFECAKHLLQVHDESVGSIRRRLQLDELNVNMLQMMSLKQKK